MNAPLRHGTAVAVLIAVAAAALYSFGEAVAPIYPVATARSARFDSVSSQIEAVTLGSSHNRAIDFETLGTDGFHLWRSGGDLAEARHTLEVLRPRLPALRLVLLSVPGFFHDNSDLGEPWIQVRHNTYAEVGSSYPIRGDWRAFVHARAAPLARPDHWVRVLANLWGQRPPSAVVQADGWLGEKSRAVTRVPPDSLLPFAENRGRSHAAMETTTLTTTPAACDAARRDLEALVDIAGSAAVAFYTPPYHPAYSRWIDEEAKCHLRTAADSLARAHPNVFYFEYDATAPFFMGARHLRDDTHLNRAGARAFSSEMRRRLVVAGVLERFPSP